MADKCYIIKSGSYEDDESPLTVDAYGLECMYVVLNVEGRLVCRNRRLGLSNGR